jgi:hypothetical protein
LVETGIERIIPSQTEGRHAIVTAAGRDAVDADSAADERRVRRTAKSCGPDAPTLVLSWRVSADDGGKQAGHRGEHEGNR